MDIDPTRLTDAPSTLIELLSGLLLAAVLVFAAFRIRARRLLVASVTFGVSAAVVLLLLANVVIRFGLDWRWTNQLLWPVRDRRVDVIVTGSLLVVTAITEACLVRKWRKTYAQPAA